MEGRILRVEVHHPPKEQLLIVLRPESVEVRGARIALSAVQDLHRFVAARRKNPRVEILLPFAWETNAAILRFDGPGATVPKGFLTEWRTTSR